MAATAPNLQPLPHMTAASHSKIPLSFGNPPRPTTCLPVSGSSSTTEEKKTLCVLRWMLIMFRLWDYVQKPYSMYYVCS